MTLAAFWYNKNMRVYAWRGETESEYQQCIRKVLAFKPVIVTDDGGDLHAMAHEQKIKGIVGGTEETTSGVKRLVALEKAGRLLYPIIAVNNARTKYLFDNRYGTGQSTLDGILRATGILMAGKNVVVCGYGWVGKGVATRARGMGAIVIVTEVDPIKAIEAKMDGFGVMRISDACACGRCVCYMHWPEVRVKKGAFSENEGCSLFWQTQATLMSRSILRVSMLSAVDRCESRQISSALMLMERDCSCYQREEWSTW